MAALHTQHSGFLLYDIARLFRQVFGHRLRDLDLSESRWRVLAILSRFEGISQTQLALFLVMGRAPLGELLVKLELDGLLERRAHPNDGRVKQLYISHDAAPVIATIRARFGLLQEQFLGDISAAHLQLMEQVLKRMYSNFERLDPKAIPDLPIEEHTLMHLIGRISRLNRRHFDEELKVLGFTRAQWLVLARIKEREGIQQNLLAEALSMSKAPLGVLIDNLEVKGWVQREAKPRDRRAKQLFNARQS